MKYNQLITLQAQCPEVYKFMVEYHCPGDINPKSPGMMKDNCMGKSDECRKCWNDEVQKIKDAKKAKQLSK